MRPLRQLATGMALCALFSSPAWAQTQGSQRTSPPDDRRRARPRRRCSATPACGLSRPARSCRKAAGRSARIASTGTGRKRSPTSRTSAATFAFGVSDRVEIFGNARCAAAHRCRPPPGPRRRHADGRSAVFQTWGDRVRRRPPRREVQPHRPVAAAAGGLGHSRAGQAADRRRGRRPRHRQGSTSWSTASSAAKRAA